MQTRSSDCLQLRTYPPKATRPETSALALISRICYGCQQFGLALAMIGDLSEMTIDELSVAPNQIKNMRFARNAMMAIRSPILFLPQPRFSAFAVIWGRLRGRSLSGYLLGDLESPLVKIAWAGI